MFLSHASEDKEDIARPLRVALEARGVTVWFDELQMKVGQSIRQEIEAGIAGCRFGVVIVSPHFLRHAMDSRRTRRLVREEDGSGPKSSAPDLASGLQGRGQSALSAPGRCFALNTAVSTVDEIADSLIEVVRADS